jgi:hypothetical protein
MTSYKRAMHRKHKKELPVNSPSSNFAGVCGLGAVSPGPPSPFSRDPTKEKAMLPAALLSPLILASEPIRLEMLDLKYDHAKQTSTFGDHVSDQLKARLTYTTQISTTVKDGKSVTNVDADDRDEDGR